MNIDYVINAVLIFLFSPSNFVDMLDAFMRCLNRKFIATIFYLKSFKREVEEQFIYCLFIPPWG